MSGEPMPLPPVGFATCRTECGSPRGVQVSHLVANRKTVPGKRLGGTPGPTLCGLTRFDHRHPDTYIILRSADIPGWSMGGGVYGPNVRQERCAECWSVAEAHNAEVARREVGR